MNCPKCGSAAQNITPTKTPSNLVVFGCPVCGHAFDGSGAPVVQNTKQLADVFKAATEGKKVLQDTFGDKMSPAERAAFTARLLEYGVQMWFDGLKQGLLLTAIQETNNGESRSTERDLI